MSPEQTAARRLDGRTFLVVVVVALAVLAGMIALTVTRPTPATPGAAGPAGPASPTSTAATMTRLTFGVWGSEAEIAAFQAVVDDYNAQSSDVSVTVESWPDADAMVTAMESGEADPDLYLLPRDDLAGVLEAKRNIPLLDLLDARGVNLGDDYSRDSLAAFSADDDLQCMPYGASPMVIYYNTDLIDFDAMAARDLPVPREDPRSWTMEQFHAAAAFASRPRTGARGVAIEPTLKGLAPFILSGGTELFDDPVEPTQLTLSEGSTESIADVLELLRDPKVTLTNAQLRRKSAVEWFEQGKVGMIAGYRDLVPQLRAVDGLRFDVMPMPVVDEDVTVGQLTGLCIASGRPAEAGTIADVLVYLIQHDAVARVAEAGFLQPADVPVGFDEEFLQPGRMPEHAGVFNNAVKDIELMPLTVDPEALDAAIGTQLRQLLTKPDLSDLEELLTEIDLASKAVLDPSTEPDSPDDSTSAPTGSAGPQAHAR